MVSERQESSSFNNSGTSENIYRGRENMNRDEENSSRRDFRNKPSDINEEKCTFFIDSSKVGKVIGRGGSKIRELQEQSGAKIIVSQFLKIHIFLKNHILALFILTNTSVTNCRLIKNLQIMIAHLLQQSDRKKLKIL